MKSKRKIYNVVELTRLIKSTLEGQVGEVWVEGELSNVRFPSSGHCYFTIKDEYSQIGAVLFRGNRRELKFTPKDGILVRVFGEISVYERSGNYQIIARQMEEGGKGALQARFEALKRRLQEEGLFDDDRKKAIPLLPQHVGIVTSPTGAAIRDILNVISRRFPNLHVILAPTNVQGGDAAVEIAAAVDLLNEWGGADVLIVGRGGGSLEDLWCFNEEVVARAIARSRIPVIAAVGHEIDFTIIDFVADLRAPTPSAAAELVVGRKVAFEEMLVEMSQRLSRSVREGVLEARNRLVAVGTSYVFREPVNLVKQYLQRLDSLGMRVSHEMRRRMFDGHQRLDDISLRILHEMRIRRQSCVKDIGRLDTQLRVLNPLAVLGRGYSITSDKTGRVVRSARSVRRGQRLLTRVAKGTFESEVVTAEVRASGKNDP